jgi:hypothetical protein
LGFYHFFSTDGMREVYSCTRRSLRVSGEEIAQNKISSRTQAPALALRVRCRPPGPCCAYICASGYRGPRKPGACIDVLGHEDAIAKAPWAQGPKTKIRFGPRAKGVFGGRMATASSRRAALQAGTAGSGRMPFLAREDRQLGPLGLKAGMDGHLGPCGP